MGTLAYCALSDLGKHFDEFLDSYYGTEAAGSTAAIADLNRHYRIINDFLDSLGRFKRIPIGTQADGSYPQSLIDLNAVSLISEKLLAVHAGELATEIPAWILQYITTRKEIRDMIAEGEIIFEEEISVGELGVGAPLVVSKGTDSKGDVDSNWDGYSGQVAWHEQTELRPAFRQIWGVTKGYQGEDFPRWYHIKIDGTSSGNEIEEASFKWSMDGGISWEETGITTDDDWIYLDWGVFVRFTFSAGTSHLNMNDEWKFYCVPQRITAQGNKRIVKTREFQRG